MTVSITQVKKQLDYLFEILKNRWLYGLKSFESNIDSYKFKENRVNLKQNDIVNTPIHNIINIDENYLFLLLDSIFMQRLRGIHHQGLAYLVYPTATHSRFEHSLGAFKLVKEIIDFMIKNNSENFKKCEFTAPELIIAAFLHDIGHYPFSHIGETIFKDFIKKVSPDYPSLNKIIPKDHEVRTANIIEGFDIFQDLNNIYGFSFTHNNFFKKLFGILNRLHPNEKIKTKNIINLILGKSATGEDIGHLINGPLDVDKLDYILREAYFTGTPFGNIDIHRIIKGYKIGAISKTIKNNNCQLVFNNRMLPSILQMFVGRQLNYLSISHHDTLRIAEATLKAILNISLDEFCRKIHDSSLKEEYLRKILIHFKLMEDRDFLNFLEIISRLSITANNLFNRLITRNLYKKVIIYDTPQVKSTKYTPEINAKLSTEGNEIIIHIPTDFYNMAKQIKGSTAYIRNYWKKVPDNIKKKFEEMHKKIKNEKENVFLIHAYDFPIKKTKIIEKIREMMEDIYIFQGDNPLLSTATSLTSETVGEELLKFLSEIRMKNSNIIIAYDKSKMKNITEFFNDAGDQFIAAFMFFALIYNKKI